VKEQVASSYTSQMQKLHGHKRERCLQAVVTGSNQRDNIGAEIASLLGDNEYAVLQPSTDYDLATPVSLDRIFADHDTFIDNGDTLVMCQGYVYLDWLEQQPEPEVERIVLNNYTSVVLTLRRFVRATINNPYRKRIVVIGSMSHRNIFNGSAVYDGAKAGVAHYVRCAAWELASKGYRIFALHPGNVQDTPMARKVVQHIAQYRGLSHEEALAYWHAVEPTGDRMYPLDVAKVVEWLVSGDADHLTGTSIDMSMGVR